MRKVRPKAVEVTDAVQAWKAREGKLLTGHYENRNGTDTLPPARFTIVEVSDKGVIMFEDTGYHDHTYYARVDGPDSMCDGYATAEDTEADTAYIWKVDE